MGRDVPQDHVRFLIRHMEGNDLLLSEEDYESLMETLELLSTPGFLQSIRRARREITRGDTYSLEEVFKIR